VSDLAAALAAVQANLPAIAKAETAKVETKGGGSYSYSYANLTDISAEILPLLARHGLAFACLPTVNDAGTFVLSYRLLHTAGESLEGEYPLVAQGGPQAQGSSITYARRYVLCALTGVAPDDDDGQAAQRAAEAPPRPSHSDRQVLDDLIAEARDLGIPGRYDELADYAARSADKMHAAVRKLRSQIAQALSDGTGEGPSGTAGEGPPLPGTTEEGTGR
jgi:hypothetical protein